MPISRRQLLRLGLGSTALLLPGRAVIRAGESSGGGRGTGAVHWLASADSGSGDSNQRAVGLAMAALHRRDPVDLVILAGDNIYNDGDIGRVEQTFQQPYRELLQAGVPFHAVLGNHDIRTADGAGQLAYRPFGMAGRWYALRRGPVEFFLIDTNANAPWSQQLPWLLRSLAASTAIWKVVVGHHPIYSSGFYGDNPQAIARLSPHFLQHRVQLYLNGHDHNYERSVPIAGTTYVTVGNGGASLRPVLPGPRSARALSAHGFASFRADGAGLTIEAWDSSGRRRDEARLQRDGSLAGRAG